MPKVETAGETLGEAKENLLDALKLVLECQRDIKEGTVRGICRQLEIPQP
ncbi:MAG: hypothetical protein KJ072_16785 [Verrucomicrobia bacterium]|nr:hypothetical protein [Verrucomicrobiota bacterium]